MERTFLTYFTDPVLRAPTIGSILMCLSASLVGVIVFLRKQSLLAEALSHAAYPGVIGGIVCASMLGYEGLDDVGVMLLILFSAFLSALAGLYTIRFLEQKLRVRTDSALCFVLASFFGIGITFASHVQFSHSGLYRQIQSYLYGQVATMTDVHCLIYAILLVVVLLTVVLFYKELQVIAFNRDYAKSLGVHVESIDTLILFLLALAVVIGIRSVGIVLTSAMLIAPAAAARQYSHKLYLLLVLAAIFGGVGGYAGQYLSVEISEAVIHATSLKRFSLPTGPMIVLVTSAICVFSLLLAPERGILIRLLRIARFRFRCLCENILKSIWRCSPSQPVSWKDIQRYQQVSSFSLWFAIYTLKHQGWLQKHGSNSYSLTEEGSYRAARIIRLHRLWEVYQADYLEIGRERVHYSAEEMEHIITPELEKELALLLNDPHVDPHHQPIPSQEGKLL